MPPPPHPPPPPPPPPPPLLLLQLLPLALLLRLPSAAGQLPTPNCVNSNDAIPCPLPPWPATYNLTESTIFYADYCCDSGGTALYNQSGTFFGLIAVDWQSSSRIWSASGYPNTYPGELTMVRSCQQAKQLNQVKRCLVYQNLEVALQWHESDRAVMNDPTKDSWFVHWQNAEGVPNGTGWQSLYNDMYYNCVGCWISNVSWAPGVVRSGGCGPGGAVSPTPGSGTPCFGGQYAWNLTTPEAQDYFIQSAIGVIMGGGEYVDGLFTDDQGGFPDEREGTERMLNVTGTYSSGQLGSLRNGSQTTSQRVIEALVAAGKWDWMALGNGDGVGSNNKGDPASCTAWMAKRCNTDWVNSRAISVQMDANRSLVNESIASFLIVRPAFAWLGTTDQNDPWRDEYLLDVGEPVGNCTQSSPGVFERLWSYGTVRMNCTSYKADPLPVRGG